MGFRGFCGFGSLRAHGDLVSGGVLGEDRISGTMRHYRERGGGGPQRVE